MKPYIENHDWYLEMMYEEVDGSYPNLYQCEEQDGVCFGLITHLANINVGMMLHPLSDLVDWVEETEINRKDYFWFSGEFCHYHEDGYKYGLQAEADKWGPNNPKRSYSLRDRTRPVGASPEDQGGPWRQGSFWD